MGISLYQRFSISEAALFLRVGITKTRKLMKKGSLNYIQVTPDQTDFFGYQLLEDLLSQTTSNTPRPELPKDTVDRIIRAGEVVKLTGLSRTTLWRMENKSEFPRRVALGGNRVGWRLSEVQDWIDNR